MSNKTQLQLNNETLASILSNVLGLPSQESVKHGAYVWKKYTLTYSETSRANAGEETIPDIGSLHTAIKVYMSKSYTFDKTTGTFTLVNPSTTTVAYGQSYVFDGEYYFMVNGSTGDKMFKSAGISSSSHQTKILNLNDRVYLKAGSTSYAFYVYSNTANKVDFVDFVVSDSPTTYPDGGTQGGYWYEIVKDSIEYGELTPSSTIESVTIQTNLKSISKILIRAKSKIPSQVYYHGLMVLDKHKEPINLAGNLFYTVGLTCLGTTLYAIRDTVADELDVSSGEITITPPAGYNAGTTYFLGGVTYEYALLK